MKSARMHAADQRALLRELALREAALSAAGAASLPTDKEREACERLKKTLFPKQRAFFFPPAPVNKRRVACCTRRAGKTTGDAAKLLIEVTLQPRQTALYVGLTAATARETVWGVAKEMVADFDLPFDCLETTLTFRHRRSTGMVLLKGADTVKEIEKRRGLKSLVAILDESGSMGPHLEDLVISVVGPGLRDLGGELLLNGTPGQHPSGLFYKAQAGLLPNWERHRWTMADNPYLSEDAKNLRLIQDEEGLSDDDPRYVREYLGEYALNRSNQAFAYDPERNTYQPDDSEYAALKDALTFYLGVDFGWTDKTAIVALGFHPQSRRVWIPKTWSASEQTSDDIAYKLREFIAEFNPQRIIGDTGGAGKTIVGQIQRDYRIHIEKAEKRDKLSYIEFVNSAFMRGDIKICANTALALQLPLVLWNAKKTDMHERADDNEAMAMVYVWRQAYNVIKGPDNGPTRAENYLEDGGEPEKALILAQEEAGEPEEPWFLQY